MIAWFLMVALGSELQTVRELEWDRSPAVTIAAQAAAADVSARVATAQALGRLHRADALPFLEGMKADPDPTVQVAVADALGWTPGSEQVLRDWLDTLDPPEGLAGRAAARDGLRVHLAEALGRQGDATDIPRLVALLAEPWPTAAAAAEGLGRLGRRGVEGAEGAVPALMDGLDRPDPRTVEACAYALRRIGLQDVSAEGLIRAANAATRAHRPFARAWLVTAVLPHLDASARADLFVDAVTDPHRAVTVAALDAIGPDLPEPIVRPWAASDDPWIRAAALGALGRMGAEASLLEALAGSEDPWEWALAIEAAERPLGVDWRDEAQHEVVRAAALGVDAGTSATWIEVATTTTLPRLRTAAVAALLEEATPDPSWPETLLGVSDPVVREAGLELLGAVSPPERVEILLLHLRVEDDLELLGTGLSILADTFEETPRTVPSETGALQSAVDRAARADTARVRHAATRAATAAGIALPERMESAATRELVLPSGEVVAVDQGTPVVQELLRIRGARVRTSRGDFTLSLDPTIAPRAVGNFAQLAEQGFYDGLAVHRVVPGFVVQTGCPRGDGWGGPGWTLPDEVSSVAYETGALGMARSTAWDTGGSQWFITTGPTPHLEGDYTHFGRVAQGMVVVRRLRRGDVIHSVEIERVDR